MAANRMEAFYIAGWHHPVYGFEPRYRKGSKMLSKMRPLTWFKGRVHSGATRKQLRKEFGEAKAMIAVGTFDLICQLSAAQPIHRRGWLFDSFGHALDRADIAQAVSSCDRDVTECALDALLACNWLQWLPYPRRVNPDTATIPDGYKVRTGSARSPDGSAPRAGAGAAVGAGAGIGIRKSSEPAASLTQPASANGPAASAANGKPDYAECEAMLRLFLDARTAQRLSHAAEGNVHRVREAIASMKALEHCGEVKKRLTGYLVRYIEEGYEPHPAVRERARR